MAKKRIVGLTEDGFRRLKELNTRMKYTATGGPRQRRQSPVLGGSGSGGSGTSPERIHFTIDNVAGLNGVATVNVEFRPCGVERVSGEDDYGQVTVWDPAGCYFSGETEYDLIGRWGHAEYMQPDVSIDPYQECVWVVTGLCCP